MTDVTHCTKCGTELIGSRRFCTACGTPTVNPRSPTSHQPAVSRPPEHGTGAYGGAPQVNPFAQTAMPTGSMRTPDYGPPPNPANSASKPAPSNAPRSSASSPAPPSVGAGIGLSVSPLAVSNVVSNMDALLKPSPEQGAPSSTGPSIPGTQIMPSIPQPATSPPEPVKKPQERTALMSAVPLPSPAANNAKPAQAAPNPQAAYGAPNVNAAYPQNAQNPYVAQAPYPQQPRPAPAPQGYGSSFFPGSRVLVTWSDGNRYPGTVHQISGTSHLIVFPDGQQHWVELPYLTAAP